GARGSRPAILNYFFFVGNSSAAQYAPYSDARSVRLCSALLCLIRLCSQDPLFVVAQTQHEHVA
ncbi:hypothetical protein FB639_004266, partial [Coemansia asiatica]